MWEACATGVWIDGCAPTVPENLRSVRDGSLQRPFLRCSPKPQCAGHCPATSGCVRRIWECSSHSKTVSILPSEPAGRNSHVEASRPSTRLSAVPLLRRADSGPPCETVANRHDGSGSVRPTAALSGRVPLDVVPMPLSLQPHSEASQPPTKAFSALDPCAICPGRPFPMTRACSGR